MSVKVQSKNITVFMNHGECPKKIPNAKIALHLPKNWIIKKSHVSQNGTNKYYISDHKK